MEVPPSQQPQSIPKQGVGCCGAGCLTLLVIGFLGLAGLIGSGWYLAHKAIDTFTSSEPANVAVAMPSDAEFSAANDKFRSSPHRAPKPARRDLHFHCRRNRMP